MDSEGALSATAGGLAISALVAALAGLAALAAALAGAVSTVLSMMGTPSKGPAART